MADDLTTDDMFEHQNVSERLARVDVADVDLDRRLGDAFDRVAQRVARVTERARIDHDCVEVELLEPVDQRTLVVRLQRDERRATVSSMSRRALDDLGQRRAPVDLRIALAEPAQIRAVEQQDPHVAIRSSASSSSLGVTSSTSWTRPTAIGRIQRRTPCRRFLSLRREATTTPRSNSRRSGKPIAARTLSMRSVRSGSAPRAAANAATARKPSATASPCGSA